ncbi:MAG: glycosyl transferase [Desulfobacteraceae bacterium]|nr:glycosyl transferase [Desulfobacteraceae bacterium]
MKIIVYCQHTLGVGHFFRTVEICRSLKGQEIILVTGGPPVDVSLPAHVRQVKLPSLQMDKDFTRLETGSGRDEVPDIRNERKALLFSLFQNERPDIFLVELYPFGRKKFRFELDPILEGIHNHLFGRCKVVCSLRDILVEKDSWKKYERRVVHTVNTWFDAVLVHSDPDIIRLDETFPNIQALTVPVMYTGFVCQPPPRGARRRLRDKLQVGNHQKLIVASAGGGKVGADLLNAVLRAHRLLDQTPPPLLYVFTGPFLDPDDFRCLKEKASSTAVVARFTTEFPAYLAAADLSISMAGYNTAMNILAARVPALFYPFHVNREQRMRAERLARLGQYRVVNADDLEPLGLSRIMAGTLNAAPAEPVLPNLDGARNTAVYLQQFAATAAEKKP